jgi:hypothetical protein
MLIRIIAAELAHPRCRRAKTPVYQKREQRPWADALHQAGSRLTDSAFRFSCAGTAAELSNAWRSEIPRQHARSRRAVEPSDRLRIGIAENARREIARIAAERRERVDLYGDNAAILVKAHASEAIVIAR